MDLTRRVRRIEERHARWFAQQVEADPRWADPHFRQEVREGLLRLRAEEERNSQLRNAYRQLAAYMWDLAGQPERAARVRRGEGHLPDEFQAALGALDDDARRQLRNAAEAVRRRLGIAS